jgi:hypothetical protein
MDTARDTLDARQRVTLKALADMLMPAAGRMPSASEADPDGAWLDRVLTVRPDLVPALTRVLRVADGRDPGAEVRRLKAQDPAGFLAVATAVAGAYHLNPDVRARYGYPGQAPSLPDPGESNHDLRDDVLAPVIQRGPIYRQAN